MSKGVNKAVLLGHVGKDPEIRSINGGTIIRDYVRKGSQVLIEGKIQTRTWDDKESGQKKYRTEILVNDLTLLGGGSERQGRDFGYGRDARTGMAGAGQAQVANGEDYSDQGISDGDIPS